MSKLIDLTGGVYGELTVMKRAPNHKDGAVMWVCKCSCDNILTTRAHSLRTGRTKTCGEGIHARNYIHGYCKKKNSPEYAAWLSMIDRTSNPYHHAAQNYRGRGITTCHRWMEFEAFIADMGNKPTKKHSLERHNNNKGYDICNCYWATMVVQGRNKTTTKMSVEKVRSLRTLFASGKFDRRQLETKFSISYSSVCCILRNEQWKEQ